MTAPRRIRPRQLELKPPTPAPLVTLSSVESRQLIRCLGELVLQAATQASMPEGDGDEQQDRA